MGKINLLEAQVANLIAAGEVVERPASAIKELLENAIDAGATRITAEIKNGGVSLIRITDDGCGMTKEDAILCVRRHATSKIRSAADLDGITTLGFRGEALAAIASVSRMRIMTRTPDAELGVVVTCEAGQILSVEESGCPLGTTILVEELFANVPARRKFLKRDASETAAAAAVLEKIALSHPGISFKFITDGTLRFQTSGDGDLQNVIYAVLGRDFAKKTVRIHDMTEGVEVEGVIGTPENCRGNRNFENFFINGRYVKCGTASAALEQAFDSYIPSDKFPCCVLSLTLNPAYVDVNVHPQKLEVKFSSDKPVFNAVYCAVRNALMSRVTRPVQPEIGAGTRLTGDSYRLYNDILSMRTQTEDEATRLADEKEKLKSKYEQIVVPGDIREAPVTAPPPGVLSLGVKPSGSRPVGTPAEGSPSGIAVSPALGQGIRPEEKPLSDERSGAEERPLGNGFRPDGDPRSDGGGPSVELKSSEAADPEAPVPWFRISGVAFNCYVFAEMEDRILIIDKHAAHERILFERMRENMKQLSPVSQLLLIPLEIRLSPGEAAAAAEFRAELTSVGFDFSESDSPGTAILLSYPSGLTEAQAEAMFVELTSRLSEGTGDLASSREQFYEKALYQASCKAAVKGGREDDPETMRWIAEQVIVNPRIRYCPHGRPVAFEMTKTQFERQFERK